MLSTAGRDQLDQHRSATNGYISGLLSMDPAKSQCDPNMLFENRAVDGIPCNYFSDGVQTFLLLPKNRGFFLSGATNLRCSGLVSPSIPIQHVAATKIAADTERGPGLKIKGSSAGAGLATYPPAVSTKTTDMLTRRKQQSDDAKKENERVKELARELKRARRAEQRREKRADIARKKAETGSRAPLPLVQRRAQPPTPGTALRVLAPEFHLNSTAPPTPHSPPVSKGASSTPLAASSGGAMSPTPPSPSVSKGASSTPSAASSGGAALPPRMGVEAGPSCVAPLSSSASLGTILQEKGLDGVARELALNREGEVYLEIVFENEGLDGVVRALLNGEFAECQLAHVGAVASPSVSEGTSPLPPTRSSAGCALPPRMGGEAGQGGAVSHHGAVAKHGVGSEPTHPPVLVEFEDNFEDCSGDGLDDGWGQGDFVDSIGDSAGDDRESGWNEGGLEGEDASPSDEYEGDEGGLEGEDAPSPSNENEGPWYEYEGDEGGHAEEVASPLNESTGLCDEHEGPWDEYEGSRDEYESDDAHEAFWNKYDGGHEEEGAPWGEHESPCTAHNFYDRMASGIASGRWPTLSDVRRLLAG